MNPLDAVRQLLTRLLGSETRTVHAEGKTPSPVPSPQGQINLNIAPPAPKGPGFTEPMGQPVDGLPGFNKDRGLPNPEILSFIKKAGTAYKVDPALIAAVLFNESGFNPRAVNVNTSGSIDRGISQINSAAHPEITDAQAYDPSFAVSFAARKLAGDTGYFGDINQGIQAYNVGRGGVRSNPGQAALYHSRVYKNLDPDYAYQLGVATPSANLLR